MIRAGVGASAQPAEVASSPVSPSSGLSGSVSASSSFFTSSTGLPVDLGGIGQRRGLACDARDGDANDTRTMKPMAPANQRPSGYSLVRQLDRACAAGYRVVFV
jgi:hypothetical protein